MAGASTSKCTGTALCNARVHKRCHQQCRGDSGYGEAALRCGRCSGTPSPNAASTVATAAGIAASALSAACTEAAAEEPAALADAPAVQAAAAAAVPAIAAAEAAAAAAPAAPTQTAAGPAALATATPAASGKTFRLKGHFQGTTQDKLKECIIAARGSCAAKGTVDYLVTQTGVDLNTDSSVQQLSLEGLRTLLGIPCTRAPGTRSR